MYVNSISHSHMTSGVFCRQFIAIQQGPDVIYMVDFLYIQVSVTGTMLLIFSHKVIPPVHPGHNLYHVSVKLDEIYQYGPMDILRHVTIFPVRHLGSACRLLHGGRPLLPTGS